MAKNTVTYEQIDNLIEESQIQCLTMGTKTTVVMVVLKNGFTIVESSSCVDKDNYNEELGKEICIGRIKNKLWELEGYKLQCELSNINLMPAN